MNRAFSRPIFQVVTISRFIAVKSITRAVSEARGYSMAKMSYGYFEARLAA